MKKVLLILIIVIIGAAAFFSLKDNGEKLKFRTVKVIRGNIVETVTASGVVNPVNTVLVGTQVSGTVSRIHADFNSPVKKGQLIAEIDPAIFEAKLDQSRANLMQARADLEMAEANLVNSKREMERKKTLLSKEILPQSEFDRAETEYMSSRAQASAAKARIAQAKATLKQDETNLRYTRILSPVDGIVISRNVNVGQTVAASFQTPTLFTIAEDLTRMQIDSSVDEADIGKVQVGQNVEFTVDAYANITFKGNVSQVRLAPTTVENVVTYNVVVMVDNTGLKLKPGMTATVSMIISDKKGVLMVPNSALRFTYSDSGKPDMYDTQGIWTLKNGNPERTDITTGISDGEYTEITSGNIKEGHDVIVESLGKPQKGDRSGRRWRFL
jgi:HlyD family secretion protein